MVYRFEPLEETTSWKIFGYQEKIESIIYIAFNVFFKKKNFKRLNLVDSEYRPR